MPPWGTRTSATATLLFIADGAVNDNNSNAPTPIAIASVFMSATIIAGHSQRISAEAASQRFVSVDNSTTARSVFARSHERQAAALDALRARQRNQFQACSFIRCDTVLTQNPIEF